VGKSRRLPRVKRDGFWGSVGLGGCEAEAEMGCSAFRLVTLLRRR